MNWVASYLAGIAMIGFGMGWAFGWPAILMTVGVVFIIGGISDFLLTKIAAMPRQHDSGDQ